MRGRGVAVLVMAGLLLVAVPAHASTTMGSSLRQRADLYVRCAATCTELQTARPGNTALRVSADGVITRWRLRAATLGAVRLRVMRPAGDGTFSVAASGDLQRLTQRHRPGQDVLYTFTSRVAVREGDQIALDHDRTAGGVYHSYGQVSSYTAATFAPAPADEASPGAPATRSIGRELLLNADIERDGDGDGFGDETQDNCPKIANDQGDNPCPPGTTAPVTQPGQEPGAQTIGEGTGTGSNGPPVQGERAPDRSARGHGTSADRRRTPAAGRTDPSGHRGTAGTRPAPARQHGKDTSAHGRRAPARPAPRRSAKRDTSSHGDRRARPAPQRTPKRTTDDHRRLPARQAPKRAGGKTTSGHDGRPQARPAPRPPNDPGFQGH